MGTNFYVAGWRERDEQVSDMDPAVHIGKRSAAGPYCWDCRLTLCKAGEAGIHFTPDLPRLPGEGELDHHMRVRRASWHDACPGCGTTAAEESLTESAAGRELGFNRDAPARKTGVRSCSSWSWAMPPEALEGIAAIEDEYDRVYTRAEFLEMLEECPVRFTRSIGEWFS